MLLFGSGYARHSPVYYNVFGVGFIDPTHFHILVLFTFAAAAFFTRAWWKTRDDMRPAKAYHRQELET